MAGRKSEWSLFDNLNPREADGRIALVTLIFIIVGVLAAVAMLAPKVGLGSVNSLFFDFFAKRSAQQTVADMMVDPDSADFRNVSVVRSEEAGTLICGEANGRNRMGGMGGFKRFVVSRRSGQAVMEQESPPSEDRRWSDELDCDNAKAEDKDLYCERSKRTTEEYEAAELFRKLAKACPA